MGNAARPRLVQRFLLVPAMISCRTSVIARAFEVWVPLQCSVRGQLLLRGQITRAGCSSLNLPCGGANFQESATGDGGFADGPRGSLMPCVMLLADA